MCAEVNASKPPHQYLADNWWPYLVYIQRRRDEARSALEPFYARMDVELLLLLGAERSAGLMLRQFRFDMPPILNGDLSAFAEDFWVWLQTLEAIQKHHDRVLDRGSEATEESAA